jgi:hypothetical protein
MGRSKFRALRAVALAALALIASAIRALADPSPDVNPAPTQIASDLPGGAQITEALNQAESQEQATEQALQSPEAAQERAASQDPYTDATPAEAADLLLDQFPERVAELNSDPARSISDVELEKLFSPSVVRVEVDGAPKLLDAGMQVRTPDEQGKRPPPHPAEGGPWSRVSWRRLSQASSRSQPTETAIYNVGSPIA